MSDSGWDDFRWADWHAFTSRAVSSHAPRGPGVYAFRTDPSGPLAYVGAAASIYQRLQNWITSKRQGVRPRLLNPASREIQFSFLKTEGTPELRRDAEMAVFRAHLERFGIPPVFNEMARFGLDAITEPILAMNVGLRDPDGKPLEPAATRAAIEQVRFVEAGLIRWLGEKPDRLFQIEPRAFEQVVAELFWKQKYEVTLTPQTRDGGKDIYAVKRDSFADFLCIVECKRYAPDSPVDVDIVRSLYGVQNAERAAMSIIATTSRFTADARKLHKKFDTQMALREYADVVRWINEYLKT